MKITIEIHYWTDDEDCCNDYSDVVVLDENNNIIAEFSDAYHESGEEKAEGFAAAVKWLNPDAEIVWNKISDRE